jgi:hypothetical protein
MLPGIVCVHIAEEGAAPAYLFRDAPQTETDSGYMLLCGGAHEPAQDLRIVDLDRYIELDPELCQLCDELPEGHRAGRTAPGQPWVIDALPTDEAA